MSASSAPGAGASAPRSGRIGSWDGLRLWFSKICGIIGPSVPPRMCVFVIFTKSKLYMQGAGCTNAPLCSHGVRPRRPMCSHGVRPRSDVLTGGQAQAFRGRRHTWSPAHRTSRTFLRRRVRKRRCRRPTVSPQGTAALTFAPHQASSSVPCGILGGRRGDGGKPDAPQ